VILGLAGVYFFLVFFNIAGEFLVNFAGFLLPGYYSLQALFTSGTADDTQVSFNTLGRMSPILMRSNANC
jgi:receptor expression-enhancing protein 5/6